MRACRCLTLLFAGLAAAVVAVRPAGAQCRLCDKPTINREEPSAADDVRIEVQTNLSFDRLVLFGGGAGSAVIRPDGSSSADGAVANIGPRAIVASVVLRGQPGRAVRVELPQRVELYSLSGGRISVDELSSDLPSLPRLDGAGNLSFRLGGRVRISGDADGDYRGDLPITAEYQ